MQQFTNAVKQVVYNKMVDFNKTNNEVKNKEAYTIYHKLKNAEITALQALEMVSKL